MFAVQWQKQFELGHERIDFEHRIFLGLIRAIADEVERSDNHDKLLRLLREVRKYADFHFLSEENIMLDHAYPQFEKHRQEHAALLARLDDNIHDFHSGTLGIEQIVEFLFQWFALHTTQEDKKLTSYLSGAA